MNKVLEDLDREIISIISKRTELFVEELKGRGDNPEDIYSPVDKSIQFKLIEDINKGPVSNDVLKKIYNELILCSANIVNPIQVAYLGPIGTFSHMALLEIFGDSIEGISLNSIPAVFDEVETGRAPFGVVPVENSTEGGVTYTLDELSDTDLKIVSEKFLRISYSLLSLCQGLRDIKKLYSHPQPLGQCKEWIRANLPEVEIHRADSTTQASKMALEEGFSAAIASERSASIYNLRILANNIEDSSQNYTRFLVIGRKDNPPTGKDKTSIVCAVKDKPGALYNMLKSFDNSGINMTKIESRPDKKKIWEYNFFIDFIGHKDDRVVKNALEEMKEEALFLKVLGSYPSES
ncbi:MAG: prephenate dehydratase [Spirochaetota bacterium]|nr:prephenate dehydratase [Spirochaetota bacterium]